VPAGISSRTLLLAFYKDQMNNNNKEGSKVYAAKEREGKPSHFFKIRGIQIKSDAMPQTQYSTR
jgi:hypothetical protein